MPRLDERPAQEQVDDQDERGQRQRDPQQQVGESAQPRLEVCFVSVIQGMICHLASLSSVSDSIS